MTFDKKPGDLCTIKNGHTVATSIKRPEFVLSTDTDGHQIYGPTEVPSYIRFSEKDVMMILSIEKGPAHMSLETLVARVLFKDQSFYIWVYAYMLEHMLE